jgi:tetratricopeptide (TPR) repeat protein
MRKIVTFLIGTLVVASSFAQTSPPKGPEADKAIAAYTSGDNKALAAALPSLIKAHPNHPYTIYFKAFIADFVDNNVSEALRGYSEVIKIAPDLMEPYFFRGRIFSEKGMYEKAIEDLTNAIKYDTEKTSNLFTVRGNIYADAGKQLEAFTDFKQAIFLSPSISDNYTGLVNTGSRCNKSDEAKTIISNAINGAEAANARIWAVWGDLNLRMKQFKISDKALDQSFLLDAASANANDYNNAAIAALNLNNFSKAKKRAEQAIAKSPDDYHYYNTRSEISISDNTWEEVYTWAKKALDINAKSARANMLMAIGIKRTNRGDALSAEYEKKAKQLEADGVQD